MTVADHKNVSFSHEWSGAFRIPQALAVVGCVITIVVSILVDWLG